MDTRILMVVAFLVGLGIGKNWQGIKKYVLPKGKAVKPAKA